RGALPFFDGSAGQCAAALPNASWKDVIAKCKSPFSPDFGAAVGGQTRAAALISTATAPGDAGFTGFFPPPYLSRKGEISDFETNDYYSLIDAPPTLSDFQSRFGFGGDSFNGFSASSTEIAATYFNRGDLGIGREMHCTTFSDELGP